MCLFLGLLLLAIQPLHTNQAPFVIPLIQVESWARTIGGILTEFFVNTTSLEDIQQNFRLRNGRVRQRDGLDLINELAQNVSNLLIDKEKALEISVGVAEAANAGHSFNDSLELDYPKSKHLNSSIQLTFDPHFQDNVNMSFSTVHVPTNVYDESVDVLNGVEWSQILDEVFRENYLSDPTIGYQYFSSYVGFFRIYPGISWSGYTDGVDQFDSRTRPWYIHAASSPKDVVVLLDSSGSMTGQGLTIATQTVKAVLNTLSEDDFFNVIKYSEQATYLDSCFDQILIQANGDNTERITRKLDSAVSPGGIANLELALTEAFRVLRLMDTTRQGSMCNKVIIIITDGVQETYEEIFSEYNRGNQVRVFTFLVGRKIIDTSPALWIACHNKGYFAKVATTADATEHVQKYIQTLSRPMVMYQPRECFWTSAYYSSSTLMTTLSQPVFDTRPDQNTSGVLLGVMGTDIPVTEVTKIISPFKLGVNGYSFAVTNNGYVIFHPDFRPQDDKGKTKPSYNSVDLSEVEISDEDFKLGTRMVNRETGMVTMNATIHLDSMNRVAVRKQHYYYAPINGTPFSLGIALQDETNWLDGRIKLKDADLATLQESNLQIAKWNYCEDSPNSQLVEKLKSAKNNKTAILEGCDMELIEHFLFDAECTRDVISVWSRNFDRHSIQRSAHNLLGGLKVVFVGTQAGLTRFWRPDNSQLPPLQSESTPTSELYYTRAMDGGPGLITFAAPFYTGDNATFTAQLTASTPVLVADTVSGAEATAAVVGMKMTASHLNELFINLTSTCPSAMHNCSHTCKTMNCYILDNNGFVISSTNIYEIGRFFGDIDSSVMQELFTVGDRPSNTSIYKRMDVVDYQAVCPLRDNNRSGASKQMLSGAFQLIQMLLSLIAWFVSAVNWIVQEVLTMHFLLEPLWWQHFSTVSDSVDKDVPIMCDVPHKLFYVPELSGNLFLSYSGVVTNCNKCQKAFSFSSIPGTNLFLLATEASCSCPDPRPISVNSLVPVYVSFAKYLGVFARVYATTPDVEHNK